MAEFDYSMFKQAIRGFDKDEVLEYVQKQQTEAEARIATLERDVRKRDRIISELKNRIVLKDEQVDRLEKDISTKYQKYIDNYRQIGDLVYESRLQADRIVAEANAEADRILANADLEGKRRVRSVQAEVDAKLNDGKQKYLAVQDEMNEIVEMFNQMQRKFMQSYKEVHEIIQSMPASLDELGGNAGDGADEDDLDDADLDLVSLGIHFDDLDDTDDYDEEFQSELDAVISARETDRSALAGDAPEGTDSAVIAIEREQLAGAQQADSKEESEVPESAESGAQAAPLRDPMEGTNAAELLQEGKKS